MRRFKKKVLFVSGYACPYVGTTELQYRTKKWQHFLHTESFPQSPEEIKP